MKRVLLLLLSHVFEERDARRKLSAIEIVGTAPIDSDGTFTSDLGLECTSTVA
jgi:hypothetical protein